MKKIVKVVGLGLVVGAVGYVAVKKVKERIANKEVEEMEVEEVVEETINVEEEIVIDNDEETIIVEDVEIVEEENIVGNIKAFIKKIIKTPIKLLIKAFGFVGKILTNINNKLEENARKEIEYYKNEYVYKDDIMHKVLDFLDEIRLSVRIYVVTMNRYMMLGILAICNLLNKLI